VLAHVQDLTEALKELMPVRARVRRGGTELDVPAEELVPGDGGEAMPTVGGGVVREDEPPGPHEPRRHHRRLQAPSRDAAKRPLAGLKA
jgi:hypothetical protein